MDQTTMNAKKWALFTGEVGQMVFGEVRTFIVDGHAVTVKLAEMDDLDKIHQGRVYVETIQDQL